MQLEKRQEGAQENNTNAGLQQKPKTQGEFINEITSLQAMNADLVGKVEKGEIPESVARSLTARNLEAIAKLQTEARLAGEREKALDAKYLVKQDKAGEVEVDEATDAYESNDKNIVRLDKRRADYDNRFGNQG